MHSVHSNRLIFHLRSATTAYLHRTLIPPIAGFAELNGQATTPAVMYGDGGHRQPATSRSGSERNAHKIYNDNGHNSRRFESGCPLGQGGGIIRRVHFVTELANPQ